MFDGLYPSLANERLEMVRRDADAARAMGLTRRRPRTIGFAEPDALHRLLVALKLSLSHPE